MIQSTLITTGGSWTFPNHDGKRIAIRGDSLNAPDGHILCVEISMTKTEAAKVCHDLLEWLAK